MIKRIMNIGKSKALILPKIYFKGVEEVELIIDEKNKMARLNW